MLMSVLQRNASLDSISMAARYLDDPEVKEEASLAATAIAESIVEKNPRVVGPVMEKVLKATENKSVAARAKIVLTKAGKILNYHGGRSRHQGRRGPRRRLDIDGVPRKTRDEVRQRGAEGPGVCGYRRPQVRGQPGCERLEKQGDPRYWASSSRTSAASSSRKSSRASRTSRCGWGIA